MAAALMTGKQAPSDGRWHSARPTMTAIQIAARPLAPLGPVAGLIASVALAMAMFAYGLSAISQMGMAAQTSTITVTGSLGAERPADYSHAGQRFAPQRSLSR